MIYDLSNSIQSERAKRRFDSLISSGRLIELKEITKRSLSQNNYLHLIISYLAMELGLTVEYVKQAYYKYESNYDLFYGSENHIDGITKKTYSVSRSSSDLTKEEMTLSIERFRNFSSQICGIYLPEPNEEQFLNDIRIEIERQKQYL